MRSNIKRTIAIIMSMVMSSTLVSFSFAEELKISNEAYTQFETTYNGEQVSVYEVNENQIMVVSGEKIDSIILVSEKQISANERELLFNVNGESERVWITSETELKGSFLFDNNRDGINPAHINYNNPVEISYHAGPWGSAATHTHNVKFEKAVGMLGFNVVLGILTISIGLGGVFLSAITAELVAYNMGNSDASRTVWTLNYHNTLPSFYAKAQINSQAGYKGVYTSISNETAYFANGGVGV